MSTEQYLRKVSLIVGSYGADALELSDFRIKWRTRRGDNATPNSTVIRVYNLSRDTAQRINTEFTSVVLQAGYEGNYGIIFAGTIKQVMRGRESATDTYVDIVAADGDRAYNFATVSTSLAAGSKWNDHVQVALSAMRPYGVNAGYLPAAQSQNGLPRGKVLFGMARDLMRRAVENMGAAWSIQDGQANVIPLTSYMPGDVPVITAATGMIGLPQQTQNGITVRMLLNPSVKIGGLIQLDNASVQQLQFGLGIGQQASNQLLAQNIRLDDDGFYYVMVAEHVGDTRGDEYYTEVICLATNAIVPISLLNKNTVAPENAVLKRG